MPAIGPNDSKLVGVTQLGYLGLGVSDPVVWREFATEVLGLQENGNTARGSAFYRMDSHHHRFEICPGGDDDILWAGWEAKDAEALDQIANQVRALGVEVVHASAEEAAERLVLGLIRFQDPEGLQTEVYHGPLIDHKPFISPRGVRGFKADDLGLGHFVMIVRDLEVMLDFYKRGLGVKISDFINMTVGSMKFQVCFTHVNPRHHSLALAQASGAPNSPRAPKQKKMNHFLLEANELDDVGVALDIFKQRGMPVGQLGKHTNDHMVSFYAPTPSGFTVEYGCNGRSIKDEESWEVRNYEAASVWGHEMPAASAPPSGAAAEPSAG